MCLSNNVSDVLCFMKQSVLASVLLGSAANRPKKSLRLLAISAFGLLRNRKAIEDGGIWKCGDISIWRCRDV